MRQPIGFGTPRGLQGRLATVLATLLVLMGAVRRPFIAIAASRRVITMRGRPTLPTLFVVNSSRTVTCDTGC